MCVLQVIIKAKLHWQGETRLLVSVVSS